MDLKRSAELVKYTFGNLEELLFCPISASRQKEKCSHMANMLRFLFLAVLELEQIA
jgi:hypothetical protein